MSQLVYQPVDDQVERFVQECSGSDALTAMEKQLTHLSLREGGMGLTAVNEGASIAFLAAFLNTANFARQRFPPTSVIAEEFKAIVRDPQHSEYAQKVHDAFDEFRSLFENSKGRSADEAVDGFAMSLEGLLPIAPKFQQLGAKLMAAVVVRAVKSDLTPPQQAVFESQRQSGAAATLTVLPKTGSALTNQELKVYLTRRILKKIPAALDGERVCGMSGCTAVASDWHDEVCGRSGIMTKRHQVLIKWVHDMCEEAGIRYDLPDLRVHVGLRMELANAGAQDSKGNPILRNSAAIDGADVLVKDLMRPGSRLAVDGTVISERATCRTYEPVVQSLKDAEAAKVGHYQRMYATIKVDVDEFRWGVGARVAPNRREVFRGRGRRRTSVGQLDKRGHVCISVDAKAYRRRTASKRSGGGRGQPGEGVRSRQAGVETEHGKLVEHHI